MNTTANRKASSAPYWSERGGALRTTSRLRMWIMTTLFRYEITSVGLTPQQFLFGCTYCRRTWVLAPSKRNRKAP